MCLLRFLRFVERHSLARPIGAAILHVAVEEEAIEVVADVVMMRDVRPRAAAAVDRIHARFDPIDRLTHRPLVLEFGAPIPRRVHAQQRDQLHDVALLDQHLAVHEGFGRAEPRVEDDAAHPLAAGEADRNLGETGRRRAIGFDRPIGTGDGQPSFVDDAREKGGEYRHGGHSSATSNRFSFNQIPAYHS